MLGGRLVGGIIHGTKKVVNSSTKCPRKADTDADAKLSPLPRERTCLPVP